LAFVGSEKEVIEAFAAAGWSPSDRLTRRTFSHAYKAWTRMRGYPTAPISTLLYEDRKPDFYFQKSLNNLAKRHHLRMWNAGEVDGKTVWLAAATHDIAIALVPRTMGVNLTHRISPYLDVERAKVSNDLTFAGCVAQHSWLEREDAIRVSHKGKGASSD